MVRQVSSETCRVIWFVISSSGCVGVRYGTGHRIRVYSTGKEFLRSHGASTALGLIMGLVVFGTSIHKNAIEKVRVLVCTFYDAEGRSGGISNVRSCPHLLPVVC